MEANLYTQIEDYLDGLMSDDDRKVFETEVGTNPELAQALATVREARERLQQQWGHAAADAALRETLNDFGTRFFKSGGSAQKTGGGAKFFQMPRAWWAAAAAIALLVTAWFFLRPATPEQLYAQYRTFPEASFTLRASDPGQQTLENAATSFNAKNYSAALELLQSQLATDPANLEAQFFSSLCLLELKRYDEAIATLEPISNTANSWADEAQWYLALSYLRQNKEEECAAILRQIPQSNWHYPEAQKLLKHF